MNYSLIFKKKLTYFLFTLPAIFLFTLFFTYPVLSGIYYSFTNWSGVGSKYDFIGLKNYYDFFFDPRSLHSFKFTIVYSFLLTVLVSIIALGLALLLNSKLPTKVKNIFRSIYFFPAVLSMIVVGLVWNEIMFRVVPLIGQSFGIEMLSKSPFGDATLAMYAVLFVNIWQGVAIPMVLFLAGLQSIPSDMYEAATIDGANSYQMFKHLTIPFLIPIINVVVVLTLKSGLTVFDYIMTMTGGGPARSTESVGLLIYSQGFADMRFGYAISQSVILLIVVALLSILHIKFSSKYEVGQL
jgi:raffinose/stachyose/melibiose transport system permease protein